MRMALISILAVALLGVVVFFIPKGKRAPEQVPATLSEFGNVGDFEFTNQDSETFSSEELEGKVWLAGFVFTSCAAECPILTAKMMEVQRSLGEGANAEYVSFSVDPQTDTPARLRDYAADYGGLENWNLLTGDIQKLDSLIKDRFLLPVARDYHERTDIAAAGFIHSNKLVVVDQRGTIRYFADGLEPDAVPRLTEAMRRLM